MCKKNSGCRHDPNHSCVDAFEGSVYSFVIVEDFAKPDKKKVPLRHSVKIYPPHQLHNQLSALFTESLSARPPIKEEIENTGPGYCANNTSSREKLILFNMITF